MLLRLFLLFTLVPVLELAVLIQIGQWLGALPTIAIVITTGILGAWLARREGFAVLQQLRDALQEGLPPGDKVMEGVLVFAGSLLLVTPGVFTDVAGFAFIAPPTRRFLAPRVLRWLLARFRIDLRTPGGRVDQRDTPPDDDPHFDHPVR